MEAKTFEVRDDGTFIPVLAVRLNPNTEADRYLLARAGYGRKPEAQVGFVVMWQLNGGHAHYDPNAWDGRTKRTAHKYITDNWGQLDSGAVIDVEFILDETKESKISERETVPV